ncbi:MAG: universal stress protein [Pseudomonadota bacterium]
MFRSILVPTDGSERSERAIDSALDLAAQVQGKVVVLSVAQPYPYSPLAEGSIVRHATEFEDRSLSLAQQHVAKVKEQAQQRRIACETIVVQSFNPSEEIVKAAQQRACDVIFMASHGRRGVRSTLMGSETQKVLSQSTIPVTVFR